MPWLCPKLSFPHPGNWFHHRLGSEDHAMPWLCPKPSFLYVWDFGFRGVSSSAKPLVKKRSPQQNFILELYNQRLEITKKLYLPTAYTNTQAFPIDGVNCKATNHNEPNCVRFAHEKAQTISFVERGFERLGLSHQAVGFSGCSYIVKFPSPLKSFSWRWAGRLWFLAIFPSH